MKLSKAPSMLQVAVPDDCRCLESTAKAADLMSRDVSATSVLYNIQLQTDEGVVCVSAGDLARVSPVYCRSLSTEVGVCKNFPTSSFVVKPATRDTVLALLQLLYTSVQTYTHVQKVLDIHDVADFLGIDFVVHACIASLENNTETCTLRELISLHDFCQVHPSITADLCQQVVRAAASRAPLQRVCCTLAAHSPDMLEDVVSQDSLPLVSETELATALLACGKYNMMCHVRVEHLHASELSLLLRELPSAQPDADELLWLGNLVREACSRLDNVRHTSMRCARGRPRCVWHFTWDALTSEYYELGGAQLVMHVNKGQLLIGCSTNLSFTVLHSLAFTPLLPDGEQAWDDLHKCYVSTYQRLLLNQHQTHLFLVVLE